MAKYKPIRIGDTVPLQQISPASEEIDGKIYISQTGVVLGRASAGDGPHEEILFEDLPGGGGGASYTEIAYADMQTAIAGGTLTPGGWYLITDAPGTDLGFLTHAVTENAVSVAGVGGYLNADFQAVGNYDGVEAITGVAPGTRHGIWRTSFEGLTITYTNLAGGTFAVGDTITGGTTGATAVILTDDGASSMTAYMTSAGVAFDGSEVLDNGNGVTADQDGAATGPTIQAGDVVIWNLMHWQLTDATVLDGTDPATNTAAYTQLQKTDADQGYITAWDVSEFDFPNAWLQYRADAKGNQFRYEKRVDDGGPGFGFSIIPDFQWGNNNWYVNVINNGIFNCPNGTGDVYYNRFFPFGEFRNITFLPGGRFFSNAVFGGGYFYNCSFAGAVSGNTVYDFSYIEDCNIIGNGTLTNNVMFGGSSFFGCNFLGAVTRNTLYQGAIISQIDIGDASIIQNNIIENGGALTGITAGANCSISLNKIGANAALGSATMYEDSTMNGNVLGAGAQLINMTIGVDGLGACDFNQLDSDASMTDIIIGANANASTNVIGAAGIISEITLGASSVIGSNIVKIGGTISGIVTGENCSIQRNEVEQGATLGGGTTMGDGAAFNDLDIRANKQISNKTLDAGVTFSDKILHLTINEAETISANVEGNRAQPGFADIPGTINITGLTTLDCTAAFAQYRGIYNLTSAEINGTVAYSTSAGLLTDGETFTTDLATSGTIVHDDGAGTVTVINISQALTPGEVITGDTSTNTVTVDSFTQTAATETIDTITNPPTAFPFTLRPAAGLVLTITGTAYAGIAAGQIALKATDYTLDGDKGEYIVLEIDPLGTGALIEKYVVNGLI